MLIRCLPKQLAEAVILWSVQDVGNPVLCMEREDADELKPMDLFLSTMDVFKDGFDGKFDIAYNEYKQNFRFSKENFIDYLKPRCLLLAENNGCFDLVLTCAFVSHAVLILSACNACFHLSRVACKLLTKILEEEFAEMFTDSEWDALMSYCRKIHDVVFPSKENRPPGYYSDDDDSEKYEDVPENKDKLIDGKETECSDELNKSLIRKERFECSEGNLDAKLITTASKEMAKGNSKDFSVAVDSFDDGSSDENSIYWDYESMSNWIICKRVADNPEHLSDVLRRLDMLQESMDPESISSNKYDIPVSDDEDIKILKKRVINRDNSELSIKFSDKVVDTLAKEVCQKKNELGNSSQNQVRPEDITDDEIFQCFEEILAKPKSEPQCELCVGKVRAFKTNWLESYHEKYPNYELVTDCL